MRVERSEQAVIDTSCTTVLTMGPKSEGLRLRYMQQDGKFPVVFQKAPGEWSPYLMDIFTTLVEIRWRVMFLIFFLSYILSWLFFGLCYWLIAFVHGDVGGVDSAPCVENVRGFTGAFLFSMETQATIGYGFRGMAENCVGAIVVVTCQDLFSCLLDTIAIGVMVTKMASARKRSQTVGFSSCAVVNLRDGSLCLSWRLGDFRGNHILEGVAKAMLVRPVKGPQGSFAMSYQELRIQDKDIVLATPATVVHKLEPGSPLYSLGPAGPPGDDFELVVSFTYTGDSTGMLHQTRTSYTPADIRWGQRFQEMLKVTRGHYMVDYALFNATAWVPVPRLSAEEFHRRGRPAEDRRPRRRLFAAGERMMITEQVGQQTFL
ncbi:kcnj16 [Pungitius sinensis]